MQIEHEITSRQTAAVLRVSVSRVHQLVGEGVLTPVREFPGYRGARLFDRDAIEALAKSRGITDDVA